MGERGSDDVICPQCTGRGMVRPPGEWVNETCPLCDGTGRVPGQVAESWRRDQTKA
jgi:DnaJ-class molecular chaperone